MSLSRPSISCPSRAGSVPQRSTRSDDPAVGSVSSDTLGRARKLVQEYGLASQCQAVRAFDTEQDAAASAPDCIDGGADVICLASQGAVPAARLASELPVPVLAPAPLTLKLAESFLGLDLSQSRRSWPEPQVRKPALIAALAAAGGEAGCRFRPTSKNEQETAI